MTDEQNEVQMDATPETATTTELTQEQLIEASKRKDQRLREINNARCMLEDEIAEHRREANSLRKSLQDEMSKLNTLITSDIAGFIRWEKEQELPLLQAAEREKTAWRELPVEQLDVTAKDTENLLKHFTRCGELCDWLCKDFPEKKPGISGEKTKDRLRDAINKISGVGTAPTPKEETNTDVHAENGDTETVEEFLNRVDDMLDNKRFAFANETLLGIYDWVFVNNHYTAEQKAAVRNIEESINDSEY
jgi:hypothetical protein